MKIIEVSELKPGMATPFDCYSDAGDMLISKGVVITQKHIDVLFRRNITTVFSSEHDEKPIRPSPEASINKPDSGRTEAEMPRVSASARIVRGDGKPAAEVLLPELADIKTGEDGYHQLLAHPGIEEVEKRIIREIACDKPSGPPLASKARQMTVKERTETYKQSASMIYASALEQTRRILFELLDCKFNNMVQIKSIVDTFIKTFVSDRNILLNISAIKHTGDEYFFNHALNVCLLAITIAASAKYSEKQIVEIGMSALLHDIGMLLVPQGIRFKQDKLTEGEWYEVRKHPIVGLHILEKIERLPPTVSLTVYQSHERENSKGYPKQRGGRFIHNYAKIVQIADIYESMSSPRPYRNSFLPYKAMETIVKMAHEGALNSDLVKCFLGYTSLFPVGSLVELSDNRIAKVIQSNGALFAKPVVSVLADKGVVFADKTKIYQEDLKKQTNLQIIRPVPSDVFKEIALMDGF